MKNINLNPGGLVGALACGGIAGAIVFLIVNPADISRGPYTRLIISALIGGAFAGNFLWGLVFKKPEQGPNQSDPETPGSGPSVAGD